MNYALCIGINDYPGTGSDLFGCVNDAQDWGKEFASRGFEVGFLLDGQATGNAIRSEMRSLAARARPGDLVVIMFAGHGTLVPDTDGDEGDGTDECWCPHDVNTHGVITDDDIHSIYKLRETGVRWVILSDSCNSGTVSRTSALDNLDRSLTTETQRPRSRFLAPHLCAGFDSICRDGRGVTRLNGNPPGNRGPLLFAGCKDDQESMDAWFNGRPNGAFTYSALRVLGELPADSTYEMWVQKIRDYLPSQRYPQEPTLFDSANNRRHWQILEAENESQTSAKSIVARTTGRERDLKVIGEALAAQSLSRSVPRGPVARGNKKHLIAEGDSWFDIPIFTDIVDQLENKHDFDVTNVAHLGDTIESMAFSFAQRSSFTRQLKKMVARDESPEAVLLSGGGNDIAGEQFRLLINPATSPIPGVNQTMLQQLVETRLRDAYVTLISAINYLCRSEIGREIPIMLHGYGYAVPDGRGFGWFNVAGPWLRPAFVSQGYEDLDETSEMVATMIDAFNDMLKDLAGASDFVNLHYNDFRPALPSVADYKVWWGDELHPTRKGFAKVADQLAENIRAVM